MNVYSPSCPDLTLIDLPGITRIAQEGQAKNIEEVTKNMATRYCGDERTIILCVIPANQDMSTSDGLQMAMKLDPQGERTIGVITKIDIMDRGTNAKKMLLNEEIKLKLGYVGVKGRSQQDIKDSMKVNEAIKEEKNYFARHPVYSNLPPGCVGTEALVSKLTSTMYRHIKKLMPSIINEIDSKIFECEKNYKELGTPLPIEERDKLLLIWRLISTFAEKVKTSISGEYNPDLSSVKKDLLGGVRIRLKFNELFIDEMSLRYKASKKYGDNDIKTALRLHMGNTLPGFTSADAFQSLINPLLQKLKDPSLSLLEEVHAIMEQICVHYINETFMRFPMFISEVTDAALTILTQDKERARLLMTEIIEANIGYMYTKDPEYIAVILPNSEKEKLEKQREKEKKAAEEKAKEGERGRSEANLQDPASKPTTVASKQPPKDGGDEEGADEIDSPTVKLSKDKAQKAMEKVLIKEMRLRIDTYFRVVVTQLADMIPKLIGHNLVNAGINSLQFSVFKKVSAGSIYDMLKEPEHIVKKRETLKRMLDTLVASRKILLRDPDLAYSLDVKSSSEFLEMREKDKARKMTAAREKKKTLMEKASEAMSSLGKAIKTGASDVQKKIGGDEKQNTSSSTMQSSQTVTTKSTPFGDIKVAETPKAQSTNVGNSKPFSQKTEADLAKDAAQLAWNNKETIIKVAKENPELVDKGVKLAAQAAQNPAPTTSGQAADPKKNRLQGLFGF